MNLLGPSVDGKNYSCFTLGQIELKARFNCILSGKRFLNLETEEGLRLIAEMVLRVIKLSEISVGESLVVPFLYDCIYCGWIDGNCVSLINHRRCRATTDIRSQFDWKVLQRMSFFVIKNNCLEEDFECCEFSHSIISLAAGKQIIYLLVTTTRLLQPHTGT